MAIIFFDAVLIGWGFVMVISPYTLRNIRELFTPKDVIETTIGIYSLVDGSNYFWTLNGKSYGVIENKKGSWFAYPSNQESKKTNVSHVIQDEAALKTLLKKCFHSGS